jgi:transcriptional regulator with XRE-family HTH domain
MRFTLNPDMPRIARQPEQTGFGRRLAELRKARNITQVQLARTLGTTQRAITYYENEADYPPVDAIIHLADALGVSADELLGIDNGGGKAARGRSSQDQDDPQVRRLWKKFRQVTRLPEKDQRAVIRLINSLANAS